MSLTTRKSPRKTRHYVRGSVIAFGEDRKHEFKGHRNLSVEEIPRWAVIPGTRRSSRKAASRSVNGFLNTGEGGTVYLGVLDDGTVRGLHMSSFQRDHVRVALTDLMDRYNPRVPKSKYRVEFIPVISSGSAYVADGENTDRTARYCWCDKHAISLYNKGIRLPVYVIEITISPFTANPTAHWTTLQLHPIYENEEGKCFFRQSASNYMETTDEEWEYIIFLKSITRRAKHIIGVLQLTQRAELWALQSAKSLLPTHVVEWLARELTLESSRTLAMYSLIPRPTKASHLTTFMSILLFQHMELPEIVELTVRQAKTHFELTLKRLREEKCSLERKL